MPSAPIDLADYDPTWVVKFARERDALDSVIGAYLVAPIEHIGSTAIVGMRAKPVIDIAAPVASLDASREAIALVSPLQYEYWPYRADVCHWFCKPSDAHRTHHLHLVPYDSPLWHARLLFRDYLRTHANAAAEYVALKEDLAARFHNDREAYTDNKTAFVERIVCLASA